MCCVLLETCSFFTFYSTRMVLPLSMVDNSKFALQCSKQRFGVGAPIWGTTVRFWSQYFFRVNCAFLHTHAFYGFLKPRNANQRPRGPGEHLDARRRFKLDRRRSASTPRRSPELSTTDRGSTLLSISNSTHVSNDTIVPACAFRSVPPPLVGRLSQPARPCASRSSSPVGCL